MKKFLFVIAATLFCASLAWSQPDVGPGLAEVPKTQPAPPIVQPAPPNPEKVRAATRAGYNKLINPAEKLDLTSPESSVRSFVWALWNIDYKTARLCVKGAQPYEKMVEIEETHRKGMTQVPGGEPRVILSDVHSYIAGETATVTLRTLILAEAYAGNFFGGSERFYLRKVENNWLILPYAKEFQVAVMEEIEIPPDDMIAKMAVTLANAEALKPDKFEDCQTNLKQLVLGIIIFSQDFDNRLPSQADWKNQIMPYVKAERFFLCPATQEDRQSYSFNTDLENKLIDEIGQAAETIMVYEGKNKEFEFRHRNQTMTSIAFADGHVKAFTRQSLAEAIKDGEVRW